MRLLMMGTGPFAIPTFTALLDNDYDICGLVTRPTPQIKTRGKRPANPMREFAVARGIEIAEPADINGPEALELLQQYAADLFVVCDYGQILAQQTLELATLGGINLHGSLLPKYRGAAPVNWAILKGDAETGVSVIHMTPRLDGGPVLTSSRTPIALEETAAELEPRLAQLGVHPVLQALRMLAEWDGSSSLGSPQDNAIACRAPRLRKADGEVDWSQSSSSICNQVRGLKPWPGTFTIWNRSGKEPIRLILDQVTPAQACYAQTAAGQVLRAQENDLWVGTCDGILALQRIQPAGKRVMDAAEFLRGHAIPVGTKLGC